MVACLRLAGQHDEDMQCREIKERIRNPEFRSQIRLANQGNMLVWLRQELIELEADCRALWMENQRNRQAPFARNAPVMPSCRETNQYSSPQGPDDWRNAGGNLPRPDDRNICDNFCGRNGYGFGRGRGGRTITGPPATGNPTEHLAITVSSSTTLPHPCHFCGSNHWDRDCTYYTTNET